LWDAVARAYHGVRMAQIVTPIPEGMHSITPHLTVNGAADYMEFLKRAFGAVEIARAPGPGGKLMHALAHIGDSALMFNDDFPEFGSKPTSPAPWPFLLHLYVPDCDATFAQAIEAGCIVTMPLSDQFWGDRYGHLQDPYGFRWAIATRKETPSLEEITRRQKALFGG
jgi:PhnB protein